MYSLEFIQKFVHSKGGILLSEEYRGVHHKLKIQCAKGHVWEPSFNSVKNTKNWCSVCSGNKKLSIQDVKARLLEIHGDIVSIDELTYKNTSKKAKFVDKDCGEWWAIPSDILYARQGHPLKKKQKQKQTTIERYGVEYCMQNEKIALKAAKSFNNSYVLCHWKTRTRTCLSRFL